MRFRPCIDIHNGKVKQIVGESLKDEGDQATENYIAKQDASYFAKLYKEDGLQGGHVILLNSVASEYYESTKEQALNALKAYPGGLQVGGGITPENAAVFLEAGASHVIVTSYVFQDGRIQWQNLERLKKTVGKKAIVIDLSCRKKEDGYYIVTDRWQKFTDVKLSLQVMKTLEDYCDEFLIHGVDVEGKAQGVDAQLAALLASYEGNKITYAGGIGSMEELKRFWELTGGNIDFTIGSALDLFGGTLSYKQIKYYEDEMNTL